MKIKTIEGIRSLLDLHSDSCFSIRNDACAHHHAEGKADLNGTLGAILATGTAVPAFIRILDERLILFRVHIDDIQRTRILAGPTSRAKLPSDHRRHSTSPFT
jgi:hypothetical protein